MDLSSECTKMYKVKMPRTVTVGFILSAVGVQAAYDNFTQEEKEYFDWGNARGSYYTTLYEDGLHFNLKELQKEKRTSDYYRSTMVKPVV